MTSLLASVRNHSTAVHIATGACAVGAVVLSNTVLRAALLVVSIALFALHQIALRFAPVAFRFAPRSVAALDAAPQKKAEGPPSGFLACTTAEAKASDVECGVVVKLVSGEKAEVPAKAGDTVADLKRCILGLRDYSIQRQRLIYLGQELKDEFAISPELARRGQLIVHLVVRPEGRDTP